MLAIRCIVERLDAGNGGPSSTNGIGGADNGPGSPQQSPKQNQQQSLEPNDPNVEQQSFAIVSTSLPFVDLVRTSLVNLGYCPSEAVGAKAYIQLPNWKPLAFDQITDSADATVRDVLGDISSAVTLKIRLYRPKGNSAHYLKENLLQILLASPLDQQRFLSTLLSSAGSPTSTTCATKASSTDPRSSPPEIDLLPDDIRKKVEQLYLQQVFNHYRQVVTLAAAQAHQQQVDGNGPAANQTAASDSIQTSIRRVGTNGHPGLDLVDPSQLINDCVSSNLLDQLNSTNNGSPHSRSVGPLGSAHSVGGAVDIPQHFVRTRIRTSFDPELELPKLHKWFGENQHPSRAQIQQYVKELNSLESRRGRKPLDVNNVVYWFKNARAAHKRQELKFINGGPGGGGQGSVSPGKHNGGAQGLDGKTMDLIRAVADQRAKGGGSLNGMDQDDLTDQEDRDSGDEDDTSSPLSQTLDLSMRPNAGAKRRRSDHSPNTLSGHSASPNSVLGHGAHHTNELDHHHRISSSISLAITGSGGGGHHKEPQISDAGAGSELDDDESDLDDGKGGFYSAGSFGSGRSLASPPGSDMHPGGATFYTPGKNGSAVFPGSFGHENSAGNMGSSIGHGPVSPEDGRRIRRSRTFIDPMSEVPKLEQWFALNTHPTHSQIVRYTDELNALQYRQKFPKLEPKNIQFWFKNRRAKYKRLNMPTSQQPPVQTQQPMSQGHQFGSHVHHPQSPQTSSSSVTSSSSPIGGLSSAASLAAAASPINGQSPPSAPTSTTAMSTVTSALNIERLISH